MPDDDEPSRSWVPPDRWDDLLVNILDTYDATHGDADLTAAGLVFVTEDGTIGSTLDIDHAAASAAVAFELDRLSRNIFENLTEQFGEGNGATDAPPDSEGRTFQ